MVFARTTGATYVSGTVTCLCRARLISSHPTVIDAMPTRKLRFAVDSPVEEAGFEPSVPLYILTVSDPLLVGPVTVPFAKRKSPVRDRVPSVRRLLPPPSVPGHRLGALRWRVTGVA